jgi:hypothetical protein
LKAIAERPRSNASVAKVIDRHGVQRHATWTPDRNTLTITTAPYKSTSDGRDGRTVAVWEKVKAVTALAGENSVLGTWKLKSFVRSNWREVQPNG